MDRPLLALTRSQSDPPAGRSPPDTAAENMRQLVQLRWIAVVGQLLAILVAHFGLGVTLPLTPMLGVVTLLAVANMLFTLTLRRMVFPGEVSLALLLDMAALTAQLYFSGGSANPFISLYLLQVVLGAILLSPPAAVLLTATACACYAFLTMQHLPLAIPRTAVLAPASIMLAARWMAFAMVAILLVLFIARISRNLRARDAFLAQLNQRAAEEEGIVRMGLFASGAAHELGTPLSSLSVLIADWLRLPVFRDDPNLAQELAEAKGEVDRCKAIVSNILHSAGQERGEAMELVEARALLDNIADDWRTQHPGIPFVQSTDRIGPARIAAEPALRQAIWSLLENAAEASPSGIELQANVEGSELVIAVLDRGSGFRDDQLALAGRLYQSTKGPGHGLGLFLAGNVARQLGGSLDIANRGDGGAAVRLSLPLVSAGDAT